MQSGGWGLVNPRSCPQFWRSIKNANSTQFIELHFGVSEQIKPLQPIGQAAEFKFESKFEPLPVIWQSLRRLFQMAIEGYMSSGYHSRRQFQRTIENFDCKINGQALGAQLGRVGRARSNTVESVTVAAGRDRLAWRKHATTILIQFESQKGSKAL